MPPLNSTLAGLMLLFDYFWLLFFFVMCGNLVIAWRRMTSLVKSGQLEEREVQRFTVGAVGTLAVFCGALQSVALVFGSPDPFCFAEVPWNHPLALATYGITFTAWALTLYWIWIGRGATTLSRIGPTFSKPISKYEPYNPTTVRVVVTLMIVLAGGGHFYAVAKAGRVPDTACLERR